MLGITWQESTWFSFFGLVSDSEEVSVDWCFNGRFILRIGIRLSIIITFLLSTRWLFGPLCCQLFAFLNQFFGVFQMAALFSIVLERYLQAKFYRRGELFFAIFFYCYKLSATSLHCVRKIIFYYFGTRPIKNDVFIYWFIMYCLI